MAVSKLRTSVEGSYLAKTVHCVALTAQDPQRKVGGLELWFCCSHCSSFVAHISLQVMVLSGAGAARAQCLPVCCGCEATSVFISLLFI